MEKNPMSRWIILIICLFLVPVHGDTTADYQDLILGEWRKYSNDDSLLVYEQYIFTKDGEAQYSEFYIEDRVLNKDTRKYYLKGNILSIGMKKLIGRGNEYYHYLIQSLSEDELIIKGLSKYLKTESERWVRPGVAPDPPEGPGGSEPRQE